MPVTCRRRIHSVWALIKSLHRVNPSPARHRHVDNPAAAQSWPVAFPVPKRTVSETATCWVAKCLIRAVSVLVFFFSDYKMAAEWLTILYCLKKKRYYRRRRCWIHRINMQREIYGEFYHLVDEVLIDEEKCLSYIRMSPCTFHSLLDLIEPYITKRETNFGKSIHASITASVSMLNCIATVLRRSKF